MINISGLSFQMRKKYISVFFPVNSETIVVAVEIIITIIIITNNKYMRSSLRAFVSMINLF